MSTTRLERYYRCWNDCEMSGCPGHTATLQFQSVSNAFHFNDGKERDLYAQTPELEALLSMLAELANSRVEVEGIIQDSRIREIK